MNKYGLYLAWLVSIVATLGSLYFSEIEGLLPCTLCWYQRICIFPLSVILFFAAFAGATPIAPYLLPLPLIGLIMSVYQVTIQYRPDLEKFRFCGSGPSCSQALDIGLGPITIPMLSLAAFFLVTFFLITTWIARD